MDQYVKEIQAAKGNENEIKKVVAQAMMDCVHNSYLQKEADEYLNKEYNF
jgi:hypothetical protein